MRRVAILSTVDAEVNTLINFVRGIEIHMMRIRTEIQQRKDGSLEISTTLELKVVGPA